MALDWRKRFKVISVWCREEAIPKTEREGFGGNSKDAEEVAFEIADGDLGGIATMATRWNKFNSEVVLAADVFFHVRRDFVVEDVFFGLYTGTEEAMSESIVSTNHFVVLATFHGLEEDGIAVNLDHDHDVFVAPLALCGETSGLVGEGSFMNIVDGSVEVTHLLALEGH